MVFGLTMGITREQFQGFVEGMSGIRWGLDAAALGGRALSVLSADIERSGKILDVLVGAMSLGHDARITTDNRQYVMQAGAPIGLSFYINAANSWEVDQ